MPEALFYLYSLRLALLSLGVAGAMYRARRLLGAFGSTGSLRPSYTSLYRAGVSLAKNLFYENPLPTLAVTAMHICVFSLIFLHIPLYFSSLSPASIQALASHGEKRLLEALLSAAASLLSTALLARRIVDPSRRDAGVVFLHLLLQAILLPWLLQYAGLWDTGSQASLVSIEVFHAYAWSRAGFHPLGYIIALLRHPVILYREDTVSLASGIDSAGGGI